MQSSNPVNNASHGERTNLGRFNNTALLTSTRVNDHPAHHRYSFKEIFLP